MNLPHSLALAQKPLIERKYCAGYGTVTALYSKPWLDHSLTDTSYVGLWLGHNPTYICLYVAIALHYILGQGVTFWNKCQTMKMDIGCMLPLIYNNFLFILNI